MIFYMQNYVMCQQNISYFHSSWMLCVSLIALGRIFCTILNTVSRDDIFVLPWLLEKISTLSQWQCYEVQASSCFHLGIFCFFVFLLFSFVLFERRSYVAKACLSSLGSWRMVSCLQCARIIRTYHTYMNQTWLFLP